MRRGLATLALFLGLAGIAQAQTNLVGPIQTYSCASHTWANSLASASGATTCTQPAYSDLSGLSTAFAQLANLTTLGLANSTQTIFGPQPNLSAQAAGQLENARALTALSAAKTTPPLGPVYIKGNYYLPFVPGSGPSATGPSWFASTGDTACNVGTVLTAIHIDQLGARVIGTAGTTNFQLAVYANGPFNRPNGAALANTANIVNTAANTLTASVSSTSLVAGTYWFCAQNNDTTVTFAVFGASNVNVMSSALIGSATAAHVLGSGTMSGIFTTGGTFGTWPTFTSATSWSDDTSAVTPAVIFHVSSVP